MPHGRSSPTSRAHPTGKEQPAQRGHGAGAEAGPFSHTGRRGQASWAVVAPANGGHHQPTQREDHLVRHNQFPTSVVKVRFPSLMYGQNQVFRTMGAGSFEVLAQAVAKDPAMLIWLDTGTDKAAHPNENFARELMERFTMGIDTFTEADVREGAPPRPSSAIPPFVRSSPTLSSPLAPPVPTWSSSPSSTWSEWQPRPICRRWPTSPWRRG